MYFHPSSSYFCHSLPPPGVVHTDRSGTSGTRRGGTSDGCPPVNAVASEGASNGDPYRNRGYVMSSSSCRSTGRRIGIVAVGVLVFDRPIGAMNNQLARFVRLGRRLSLRHDGILVVV